MRAAPKPTIEVNRQAVVDSLDVLDTDFEPFSDAIAIAAASLAGVDIAAISLVDDDRQWFKGSCGLAMRETPRDISFCAHAVLQADPFLIVDATLDPRFATNPLVTGAPFIRFYAGFPLVVRGEKVGSLCVIDSQPKVLSPEVIKHLSALAAGTSDWLSGRRVAHGLLRHTEAELRRARSHDSVTGLPNRLTFDESLDAEASRCDSAGTSLAVLFVDLDGFKATQALWGHSDAEGVLRTVATRLRMVVRTSDVVAYQGGDQFLILASGVRDSGAANRIATQIALALEPLIEVSDHRARFTASIGIALYPDDATVDKLVASANTAMLSARQSGGNSFCSFKPMMSADGLLRMQLVEELRSAIERNELELHYQPKVDALSEQTTAVEALLRWNRPGRATLGPALFVPIAESAGLINALGDWVISAACRQMGAWCEAGIRMRVSINISVHQLRLPQLGDQIAAQLAAYGVDPSLLTCEITESVAMDDATTSLATFEKLVASGIRLSIDDFGTGYSSLSYLRKLPVSQLKIDRSFITDLATDEVAKTIVASIIRLSHALQLEVVAEGVETTMQRDVLLGLGCDAFQGYLFAKPMSAESFTRLALEGVDGESGFRASIYGTPLLSING